MCQTLALDSIAYPNFNYLAPTGSWMARCLVLAFSTLTSLSLMEDASACP